MCMHQTKPGSRPCACTTVKKLSRILTRAYDEGLSGTGINITQLAVMRCIGRRQGEPLVRVAEELEMDRTSLYRAIAPMVRDGWLSLNDGADARSRTAVITRKGDQVLTKAAAGWEEMQDRLVKAFGKKEWDSLAKELNRLAECFE
jgi:DNA-binding MarR family transcriptional regulator